MSAATLRTSNDDAGGMAAGGARAGGEEREGANVIVSVLKRID
jgi:hypothetical protein